MLPLLVCALSCAGNRPAETAPPPPPEPSAPTESAEASEPAAEPETSAETGSSVSTPSVGDVAARVASANARLAASAGGALVWRAIEAHGGLEAWLGSGPLQFRFAYQPAGRPAIDTFQVVDPWSARARQQVAPQRTAEFGWDGQRAWVQPPDAKLPTNPRFWSLTPYYFVGMPFVLGDPGVRFEQLADASFEDESFDIVKATFEPGTGDAPGDHYVLYLDKESGRLRAVRYVVSYPGFYPDGGHGAEKLMSYDGELAVGDIIIAASHRTFTFDEATGTPGEKVTDVTVSDARFRADIAPDYFLAPAGARIIEGWK